MIEDSMITVNFINGFGNPIPVMYKFLGDTVLNSKSYFKVFKCSSLEDSSYVINSNLNYYGAIREVNKKVYFLIKDSSIERKIYDFNLGLNDTTSIYYTSNFLNEEVVVSLDKINTVDTFYGRSVFEHSHNSSSFFNHYYIVQGFGVIYYSSNEIDSDFPTRKVCAIKKNNPQHSIPSNYSECYWKVKKSFISVKGIESNNIEVYPNPAVNEITIQSNNTKLKSIVIYDTNGKLINQIAVQNNKDVLDIKSFESGVYTLQFVTENGIFTQKFVKQ